LDIYNKIRKVCTFRHKIIEPGSINKAMESGISLNDIEAEAMASLIKSSKELDANADIFIDLMDRYSWVFQKRMSRFGITRYEAQHHADSIFPVVSAASICAKCMREKSIKQIRDKTGIDFGSGYPSDPKTRDVLRKIPKGLIPHIRTKWKTLDTVKQRKILEF